MEVKPTNAPEILIVDDVPDSIDHLKAALEEAGCTVTIAKDQKEAVASTAGNIFDLALLDVNLNRENKRDRGGIDLAERLAVAGPRDSALAPEALVLFISRPLVMMEDAPSVLSMFNRRADLGRSRKRLAEAYAEKDETERVLQLVKELLSERGWFLRPDGVDICGSETFWGQLGEQAQEKFVEPSRGECVAPGKQLFQILRTLCVSSLGTTRTVNLSGVSRGRSRSIVLSAECQYRSALSEWRIVKIASRVTIEMEVKNYAERVPSVFAGGSYPLMTGFAMSRSLAGISYSELGKGEGVPDSLADRFWGLSSDQIKEKLDDIYHNIIVDSAGCRRAAFNPFNKRYSDRFRNLKAGHELHARVKNILQKGKFLVAKGEKEVSASKAAGVGADAGQPLVHPRYAVLEELTAWRTTGFYEAVVHGDLHPDNILMPSENQIFLIDFAHTEVNHAALDYVVMEAMMRSQMLRYLFDETARSSGDGAMAKEQCKAWFGIERAIGENDWETARRLAEKSAWGEKYVKLVEVISWLRTSARKRNFMESPEFYFAGLGAACYSFVGLPDASKGKDLVREVLLYCSALSLTRAFSGKEREAWVRESMAPEEFDKALAECSAAWRGWMIKKARVPLSKCLSRKCDSNETIRELNSLSDKALDVVRGELPAFCSRVEDIALGLKVGDKSVGQMGVEKTAAVTIIQEFFDYMVNSGQKWRKVAEILGRLRSAAARVWEE